MLEDVSENESSFIKIINFCVTYKFMTKTVHSDNIILLDSQILYSLFY